VAPNKSVDYFRKHLVEFQRLSYAYDNFYFVHIKKDVMPTDYNNLTLDQYLIFKPIIMDEYRTNIELNHLLNMLDEELHKINL
jgi:hypothetical protein